MKKKVLVFGILVILCLLFLKIAPAEGSVDTILENNNQEFSTQEVTLEIKEPVELAGETLAKNKNKRMDFEFPEGNLRLYFDLLNYSEFVDSLEGVVEAEKTGAGGELTGNLIRTFFRITSKIIGTEEESAVGDSSAQEPIQTISETANEELQESLSDLNEEEVEILALDSATEAENFNIIVDEKRVKEEDEYKWGYEVKLKELKFFAKIEVTSDEELEIWGNDTIRVGSQLLSFADLAAQGYNVRLEAPALAMGVPETVENIIVEENLTEENATGENASTTEENVSEEVAENLTEETEEVQSEENVSVTEETAEQTEEEQVGIGGQVSEEVGGEEKEEAKEEKETSKEEQKQEKTSEKEENGIIIVTGAILRGTLSLIKNVFFVFTSITGRILNADLQYENKINVYIERDFTDNTEGINVGDIISLDPTLIKISKAIHLDENKSFISDIYSAVYELDGVWSEVIGNGEYVRVSFEQNLTKDNDITIYAKSNSSETAEIEVYSEDEIVAKFENIADEGGYKVYLTNLIEENDVFELKIIGSVEFEYIVDPTQAITEVQAMDAYFNDIIAETNFTHLNISDTTPYDKLVAYYPFDGDIENTQTIIAYDFTGNNDGKAVGNTNVSATCGIYGNGVCFDGISDYIVNASDVINMISPATTISFWVNSTQDIYQQVVYFDSDGAANATIIVIGDGATATLTNEIITILTQNSSATANRVGYTTATRTELFDGGWHHIAIVGNTSYQIYLDGVSKTVTVGAGADNGDLTDIATNTLNLYLSNTAATQGLNGTLDEVMIFNESLTAAQISDIYNNQSGRFKASGTQELYNQSYLSIPTGNNIINVSASYENNLGSLLSLFLGYYDDTNGWQYTDAQNLSAMVNFTVLTTTTNLTLNFTFEAGNDTNPFYSPILKNLTLEYSYGPMALTEEQSYIDAYLDDVVAEVNFTHLNISDTAPYDSLVGYWNFDGDVENDGTGTAIAYDFTNYNNDGKYNVSAEVISTDCVMGKCFKTNMNSSITVFPSLSLDVNQSFALSVWINGGNSTYYQSILGKESDGGQSNDRNFGFWLYKDGVGNPIVRFSSGGTDAVCDLSSADINAAYPTLVDKGWQHLVVIYNITACAYYLNGNLMASDTSVGVPDGAGQDLIIGSEKNFTYPTSGHRTFNGTIDEVMIFNSSLSDAQVLDIYNNQSGRFKATGTQEIYNQSYFNIPLGSDIINVFTSYDTNMGSLLSVFLGYYDDTQTWKYTDAQNLSAMVNFSIPTTTTNLTLNFTFEAGNDTNPFYSPILRNVTVEYFVSPVTEDTTPPNINITHPENTTYSTASIDFNVSADEDLGNCSFNISDGSSDYIMTINNTEANYTHDGLADGQYFVNFTCNDTSGNTNNTESVWFVIDAVAPIVTIITPLNNSYSSTSSVEFNASLSEDNTDWCGLSIDGNANETMTAFSATYFNYTNDSIAEGAHNFIINCNDTYSKIGASSIYDFYVDATPPDINFGNPTVGDGVTQGDDSIYVNVSANDALSNISTFIDFDNSLALWLRMDDINASGEPVDYFGINNGSVFGNALQNSSGVLGKGFSFDGDGDYVYTPATITSSSSTFGGWVKWNKYPGGGLYDSPFSDYGFTKYGVLLTTSGEVGCIDQNVEVWTGASEVQTGEWYQVFCVHNSTDLILYINGTLKDFAQSNDAPPATGFIAGGLAGYWSNSTIDDYMVFNRSLSGVEIANLYANSSSSFLENNFTELLEGTHNFKAYSQDNGGNVNSTETRTVNIGIALNLGWNLVSMLMENKDVGTDRNIPVVNVSSTAGIAGWNLVGYSSDAEILLENANFTNSTGDSFTWAEAVENNKVSPYFQYFDGFNTSSSERKYKYTATADLEMDDTTLRRNHGYWVYISDSQCNITQSCNITLPGVGGTLAGETYNWSDLRFSNGTDEKSTADAVNAEWIKNYTSRWGPDCDGLTPTLYFRDIGDSEDTCRDYFYSWEGVWIWGYTNNITMIRRN